MENCYISKFIEHCKYQNKLDKKTVKTYSIDLRQYFVFSGGKMDKNLLTCFIEYLHKSYKSKTVKRKIATLKIFANYLFLKK